MYLCKNLSLDFTGDHCYKAEEKCKLANIMKNKVCQKNLSNNVKFSIFPCRIHLMQIKSSQNKCQVIYPPFHDMSFFTDPKLHVAIILSL